MMITTAGKQSFCGEIKVAVKRSADGVTWHATVYDVTAGDGALPMAHGRSVNQATAVELARLNALRSCNVDKDEVIAAPLVPASELPGVEEPPPLTYWYMSTTLGRNLVIGAISERAAINAARAAGYPYLGTTVYPVTDYYRAKFVGCYIALNWPSE